MSALRILRLVLPTLALAACFGPTEVSAPAPSEGARSVLITRLELSSGTLSAHWLPLGAEQTIEPHLFVQREGSGSRLWMEFHTIEPQSLGLEAGPIQLVEADRCGSRALPHAPVTHVLEPGTDAFVLDPTRPRPELLYASTCLCPAPEITAIPVEPYCALRPAALPDGKVILVFVRKQSCTVEGPGSTGYQKLDLNSLELSASESLADDLHAPRTDPSGEAYWGSGDVYLQRPTTLYGYASGPGLRTLSSTSGAGRTSAIEVETSGRSLLLLTTVAVEGSPARSQLLRADLRDETLSVVEWPDASAPAGSQNPSLVQYREGDVLVFPENSSRWYRVTSGVVDEEVPIFPGVGVVVGATKHPELGVLITTRTGEILRFDGTTAEPLEFDLPGGPQRLSAPFPWQGSLGFFTVDGLFGQYHPDERRCPLTSVYPNLKDPAVAIVGDGAVVTGLAPETRTAVLFLLRPGR